MFNAINRLVPFMALTALAGCGNSASESQIQAQQLIDEATMAIEGNNPQKAIELLDSVDSAYKTETEIIKESIRLRPKAMEALTIQQIAVNDSTLASSSAELEAISQKMNFVSVPQTDGYYVAGTPDKSFTNGTAISARVTPAGEFYIVSSVNPAGGLNHWSVSAISGQDSATTDTVPYDGALNYRLNNSELITFSAKQSASVGEFIFNNRSTSVSIRFNGQNGRHKQIALSASQTEAIATAFEYARLVDCVRTATFERERLEKKLQLARDQAQKHQ